MSNIWEAAELDYHQYLIATFRLEFETEADEISNTQLKKPHRISRILKRKEKTSLNQKFISFDKRICLAMRRRNQFGIAPLHTAIFYRSKKVLDIFLQCDPTCVNYPIYKCSNNNNKHVWQYPLNLAILRGKGGKKMIQKLLHAGADPFLRDNLGQNAWDIAKATFQRKTWKMLEEWIHNYPPSRRNILNRNSIINNDFSSSRVPLFAIKSENALNVKKKFPYQQRNDGKTKSINDLVWEASSKRSADKIPHGPWDNEGCFVEAACGSCPEERQEGESVSSLRSSFQTFDLNTTTSSSSFTVSFNTSCSAEY